MSSVTASEESAALNLLLSPLNADHFQNIVRRLRSRFKVYAATCPVPIPAPGLIVTPEIRAQCECYLPLAEITAAFHHLYLAALAYPPILSSTPFHSSLSWADTFALLPAEFKSSPDPAHLLETLLSDNSLLARFLFASFLPDRFYGGIGRYPYQTIFIREWLTKRKGSALRCLDAACGTGEATYHLARLIYEHGYSPERTRIVGWTLEPLEVWAASFRRFPNDRHREMLLREATAPLFSSGYGSSIFFRCQNILELPPLESGCGCPGFNLIICNGLLGGPIINESIVLERAVANLTQQLVPNGVLLAADNFHGGWKRQCPQSELRALFNKYGLKTFDAGEGIGGLKFD